VDDGIKISWRELPLDGVEQLTNERRFKGSGCMVKPFVSVQRCNNDRPRAPGTSGSRYAGSSSASSRETNAYVPKLMAIRSDLT
jgi:hypothetical protein